MCGASADGFPGYMSTHERGIIHVLTIKWSSQIVRIRTHRIGVGKPRRIIQEGDHSRMTGRSVVY